MKFFIKHVLILLLVAFGSFTKVAANCANASLSLNSITETSPGSNNWVVSLSFCADHGSLLTSSETGNFRFTFTGSTVSVFPPSIVSQAASNATYTGSLTPSSNTVTYSNAIDWFHYLQSGVGQNFCYPVSFTVSGRPTSITLLGIEAADILNGVAGCPLTVTVPPVVANNNVTFCVDYTCVAQTAGFAAQQIQFEDGPFVGFRPLARMGTTDIWCATFALPVGSTVRYNFFYAGAAGAGGPENLSGATACTTTGKRTLTVANQPQSVTFAWESCVATPVCQTTNNVTFCVDYTCVAQTPGFAAQQIQFEDGPFAGFRPLARMGTTDIWCATFSLPVGSTVRYNFFYAGAAGAGGSENLSGATACTTTGKRTLTVVAGAPQSVTFAWESCLATANCQPTNNVTFCVDYTCVAQTGGFAAQQIQFEDGPFAGFRPLARMGTTDIWCATFSLPVGSTVRYNFFFAGAAGAGGPENLTGATACTTTGKRTLTVAGQPQSVTYAWQSCVATPDCGPATVTNNVTFCVDYTCVAGAPGFAAQQIQFENGPFAGFQTLTQTPGTNIWCRTFALPVGLVVRYNFFYAAAAGAGGPENLAGATACTVTGKRTLTVAAGPPAQLVTFAWQSCSSTPVCPPPPAPSVAAPAPICNQANVISVYSDTYTNNIAGTNFNPNWGQSGFATATTFSLGGNQMRYYPYMNYQGIALGSNQNISAFETLRLNIWSADCSSIDIYLVTVANGEKAVRRSLTLNAWNSIEIPLTEYTGQGIPLTAIKEFKFVTITPGSNANIYVDNIYFARTNCTFPGIWREDGLNCGGDFTYSPSTQIFTGTSTNCYYANPFSSDELAFATQNLCGNGSITALVTSISGSALGWAGVTMRESNAPGAKKAQLMTNLSQFSRREVRTTTGGTSYPQQFPSQSRYWLRIKRTGVQFEMSVSPNGTTWYPVGAQNITMNNCIDVGLVITNYTENSTVTATFSNVSVTGSNPARPAGTGNLAEDIFADADFTILPNPTSGYVEINMSAYGKKDVQMEIYNLQGKLMRSTIIDATRGVEEVDMTSFVNGMYLIRMKAEGFPDVTRRLVIQH